MADDIGTVLAGTSGFQWDEGNAPKVVDRHGVEPGECEQVFFRVPFLVSYDPAHSKEEPRWRALGRTVAGRRLLVVFTVRGPLIRVLAARDLNRKERAQYAEIVARTKGRPDV
ncbi:MAG: BrnT family toxin [Gemmatimonadaceae bacterium]|nr:BrnT family toxin [Geodermatophilaceae bacterium]MBA3671655.1 BrnT family toxin [Gemmatimonadaceae bacterium]